MQKKWAKETKLMKNGETLMTAGTQAVDHDESAARLCNLPPHPLLTFSHTSPHSPVPPGIEEVASHWSETWLRIPARCN